MSKLPGYISLYEAAKYCDYSQEYLSLRARQKKLKAVKFNRNWVTTEEWMNDYIKMTAKGILARPSKIISPPNNLPIGKFSKTAYPKIKFAPSFILLFTAFSILFLLSSLSGRESITSSLKDFGKLAQIVGQSGSIIIGKNVNDISKSFANINFFINETLRNLSDRTFQASSAIKIPQENGPAVAKSVNSQQDIEISAEKSDLETQIENPINVIN